MGGLSKMARSYLGKILRGRMPWLYSTMDNPMVVPVQLAAYELALERYVQAGDAVLDVGMGLGYGLETMARRAERLYGVDIDQRAVERGQGLLKKEPKIQEVRRYDGMRLPYGDRSMDVVTSVDVIEHVPDYQAFLAELLRVSRRVVLISTPNRRPENTRPDGKPRNYWHLREWSAPEFETVLKASGARYAWHFINGPLQGPFTYSEQPQADTQALTPALFVD